jgi:hypothetical protein
VGTLDTSGSRSSDARGSGRVGRRRRVGHRPLPPGDDARARRHRDRRRPGRLRRGHQGDRPGVVRRRGRSARGPSATPQPPSIRPGAATRRLTAGVSTCFASRGRPATGSFDATAGSGARLRQPLTTIRPVSRISSRSSFSSTRHGNRGKRMRPTSGSQPARSRTQARWLGDALRVIEPDHRWIKRLDELSG